MFGDDPDPLVTTARVVYREVFGRMQEGVGGCAERLGGLTRGKRKHGWSRKGQWKQGVMWQLRADTGFMKTYGCDAHDAMRWDAWHEQNAKQTTKTQPRRKYQTASPEKARVGVTNMESYIRGVTTLHHYNRISSRDLGWHRREKRKRKRRGKTKLLLWQTSETNKPWEVENLKKCHSGDERNWNTPLDKRNKWYDKNQEGCKGMNQEFNGQDRIWNHSG